ncbi:hypothetical protein ONE63_001037 [Megalurothrips usitatus]|uniref:Peptidase M14 domain-containing protein n=1 Tax=Megalurothrips usitatus TaxID=439358 RepID=A0AAV7XAS9_9NEOP|nr:hypothetical protein ONE63_001037 [Megalurothrips usitatus]
MRGPAALAALVLVLAGVRAAPPPSSHVASGPAETTSTEAPATFRGHKVLRVVPSVGKQVLGLRQYLHDHPKVSPWLEPSAPGRPVDLQVGPADADALKEYLAQEGLVATEMIVDLGRMVEEEQRGMIDAKRSNIDFGWDTYHTLDEIYKWLQNLAQKYPKEVSLVEGGRTYEGRTIIGVKIKSTDQQAPIAFVEAGIHAREWITPATATFLINEILTREDGEFRSAVRAYEWHIFPVTNPDGYVYTHTTNRLWRKSRSKYSYFCSGADLNRNWPFHWREAGASAVPCSETYAGVRAESEPETKAMRHYLDSLIATRTVLVYVSLHSYSQLLMFPWGWTSELTKTHDDLNSVAELAVKAAAKRHGTQFKFGAISKAIYPASGSTLDYAYDKGVKYPMVFELRDDGTYGFLLPREQIRPAAEETVDAICTIASEAGKRK